MAEPIDFGVKTVTVMADVPGLERPLALAGAPSGRILARVPQIAGVGIGPNVLSCAGSVTLSVTADGGLVTDAGDNGQFRGKDGEIGGHGRSEAERLKADRRP